MNRRVLTFLLLTLTIYLLFFKLGSYPLIEPSDARYAEVAREMLETGDYLVPKLFGITHLHKPPLIYWVTVLGYRIFGVNEWGARFFQGVFALSVSLLVFFFGRSFLDEGLALLSSLVLVLTPGFIGAERNLTTDVLLLLTVTASMFSFFAFYRSGGKKFLYLFYVACGFSLLTKGPMGVVVIAPAVFLFLLWEKNLSFIGRMLSPGGIFIALAVALPWYLFMAARLPGFIDYIVNVQVLGRIKGAGIGHRHSALYFVYVFPLLTMPWLPFSIYGGKGAVESPVRGRDVGLFRFLVCWAVVPPLLFSLPATKLPLYVLPSIPPVALLSAVGIRNLCVSGKGKVWLLIPSIFLAAWGAVFLGAALFFRAGTGHGLHIPKTLAFAVGSLFMAGGVGGILLSERSAASVRALVVSFCVGVILLVGFVDRFPFPTARGIAFSLRSAMGDFCPRIVEDGTVISGLPFYTGCPVVLVDISRDLRFESGRPSEFMDEKGLKAMITSSTPFILVEKAGRKVDDFLMGKVISLWRSSGYISVLYAPSVESSPHHSKSETRSTKPETTSRRSAERPNSRSSEPPRHRVRASAARGYVVA